MTRVQAKEFLTKLGIESPTEEQVTQFLDSVTDETKSEKARADKYKADADKASDLQKQLDDLQNAQLSDVEKANKAVEEANKKIAELEAREALGNQRRSAMEKFKINAEQAKEVVKDDGTFDFDALGKIISEKESAAATAKEQEIAKGSKNPGGGNAGGSDDEKTTAEKLVAKMADTNNQSGENSVISHYINN